MPKKDKESSPSLPFFFQGLLWIFCSITLLLSLVFSSETHPLGLFGRGLSALCYSLFGVVSFFVAASLFWLGLQLLLAKSVSLSKFKCFCLFLFFLSSTLLLTLLETTLPPLKVGYHLGGAPFYYLYHKFLQQLLGATGTALFSIFALLFSLAFFFQEKVAALFKRPKMVEMEVEIEEEIDFQTPTPLAKKSYKLPEIKEKKSEALAPRPIKKEINYQLPPPTLLTEPKKRELSSLKSDLNKLAGVLEETLQSFAIAGKVGNIQSGPTIVSFEVHPPVGVKVQKIKALENDIALNMQARSIRIIAPIPGKAAVGIEVPSPCPQEVGFRELQESYQLSSKKAKIPLLLGKAVNGEEIIADLTKTPHLLIAGATGSGKSVCINTLVMSILMNSYPDEVKFIMVDPKKVELSAYSQLPHMLAPVITEADEARSALLYLVREMEKRYEIFRHLGVRNIESFNTRTPNKEREAALEKETALLIPPQLPYIVLIIDEFADLILSSTNDIETPIARIAQMARATGIHMILATQRPSREVITGLIKANFPSRISFKVASRVNSQIIIDENGAEALLGNGDMLFLPPGSSNLIRAQGAFIRDEDIHQILAFISNQAPANYQIASFGDFKAPESGFEGESEGSDPLYAEAKSLVVETGSASTTFLQRKLKIGYARAASLMDELEKQNIIGPQEGAKPRKVFYNNEDGMG